MAHEKTGRDGTGRSFPERGWIVGYYRGRPIPCIAGGDGTEGAATGATPGPGTTPGQAAPNGAPAGAMPAGAAGSPPATANQEPSSQPATGADGLGDAGRRAIESERESARTAREALAAANAELEQLRTATQSDAEKALNQARREAKAEADGRWSGHIRSAEVRSQLRSSGMSEKTLDLAVLDPRFAQLKVDADTGAVEKVAETVDAFKKDHPELFAPPSQPTPGQGGSWDGSAGGGRGGQADTLEAAVMQRLATQKT